MNEKAQEYLSNAGVAFVGEQYDVALELCEKAIVEDPSNADAHTGAGKACLVLEKLQDAEQYFRKAIELDRENGERYFDLGNIKFGLEQFPEALQNYASAEQFGCDDEIRQKLHYQIGLLSYMSGDIKAALINFEKADGLGVINDDTKEMLIQRVQIYLELEDYSKAENCALQLKLLAPDEFRSYQIYFQVLMAVGKYDRAEEMLAEAEKYSDIDSDILNATDMCFNRAMMHAVKAEIDSENITVHYQSAIAIFDEFLTTPELPQETITNIAFTKSEIFLKMEKYDEALQCVDSISVADVLYAEDESIDDDIAEGEEPYTEDVVSEKVAFIKLTCYLGLEDYENASNCAERLKESTNEEYSYFATYADAFIAQKHARKNVEQKESAEAKYNNAIAYFRNKAFANPMDFFAIIFRVRLYAENGKFAQAEELIKILPDALQADLDTYVSDCRKDQN